MSILERIKTYKLTEIAAAKAALPEAELARIAADTPAPRGFAAALDRPGYGLIAEIKKASPSKGLIRAAFDPAALARAYAAGGAACLSVLTDAPSFQGSADALRSARAAVDLPILRKEFMHDPYQVTEARAWGADAILLILAAIADAEARELADAAAHWGLDVLVEVHTAEELDRARALPGLIGINNRDLNSFETTLETTLRLAPRAGRPVVAESGLATPADLAACAAVGVTRFLIGESLMRQPDVEAATQAILA